MKSELAFVGPFFLEAKGEKNLFTFVLNKVDKTCPKSEGILSLLSNIWFGLACCLSKAISLRSTMSKGGPAGAQDG